MQTGSKLATHIT